MKKISIECNQNLCIANLNNICHKPLEKATENLGDIVCINGKKSLSEQEDKINVSNIT